MNILNKLTIKHLRMNKKRTIVSIIGIILSTALMVGIGLLLSTFREIMIEDVISYKGDYHASFSNVSVDKINIIKNNTNIDSIYYKQDMGFSIITENNYNYIYKPYYHLYGASKEYFNRLSLVSGRLPLKNDEIVISNHLDKYCDMNIKVGDTLTLSLGNRYFENEPYEVDRYTDGEYLITNETKTYKVVGIVKRDNLEDHSSPGYSIFTILDKNNTNDYLVFTKFKSPGKTEKMSKAIAINLGFQPIESNNDHFKEVNFNYSLLAMYGVTQYDNLFESMISILAIILSLVSIACIIVIYNSFAISVMERKKQFGLFSSIGATKKQIRKTVIFEAIIVSIIGIPLGVLSAYLGIGIVITIMNNLISEMLNINMQLCTYPIFLIVPIIFMIVTVFISAIIPALKASRIAPIEAIRLNDDIKIKGKKVKSPKLVQKLFGIEGDIAFKNMKRNKKKYRITVASLFISIVLFVSFSGFMGYAMEGSEDYLGSYNFDAILSYPESDNELAEKIINNEYVDKSISYTFINLKTRDTDLSSIYTERFDKLLINSGIQVGNDITIIILQDNEYEEYLRDINQKIAKPILYSNYSNIIYSEGSRKSYSMEKYYTSLKNKPEINLTETLWDDEKYANDSNYDGDIIDISTIKDYYITPKEFWSSTAFENYEHPVLVLNSSLAKQYNIDYSYQNRYAVIKANDNNKFDDYVKKLEDNGEMKNISYSNITKDTTYTRNTIFVIKLLVYGFICLVTLIGVTSVFNTINTSISLRRKEFAVLRSIGLTPKGFKKMLLFESLFFGLKSLVYALPVSFGVIILIAASIDGIVSTDHLLIPWNSIIFAFIGVFIIIAISMTYATKRIKNENILDAIRQENI